MDGEKFDIADVIASLRYRAGLATHLDKNRNSVFEALRVMGTAVAELEGIRFRRDHLGDGRSDRDGWS
ncbi:hypothetical protein [Amycolatopsis sp. CA-230715]|uniref:hypothetical protein n=1 Tax=Amycolatopsis sp. CA-230715 TaxID=2745196 RepID=UPI001C03583B|nr:hypothetical protein [Amycolatopsis sp. CA-230715]QWF86089.1 hypothetical protein HUW46_09570 [Amycolatopsis sp. CA-230715]